MFIVNSGCRVRETQGRKHVFQLAVGNWQLAIGNWQAKESKQ